MQRSLGGVVVDADLRPNSSIGSVGLSDASVGQITGLASGSRGLPLEDSREHREHETEKRDVLGPAWSGRHEPAAAPGKDTEAASNQQESGPARCGTILGGRGRHLTTPFAW